MDILDHSKDKEFEGYFQVLPKIEEKIAADFEELSLSGKTTSFYKAQVHRLREAREILDGMQITLVDDSEDILRVYVPLLELVTNGEASFIQTVGQPPEEIVNKIIDIEPDIVLMDYYVDERWNSSQSLEQNWARGAYTGRDLTGLIRDKQDPKNAPIVLGFSSDDMFQQFTGVGANGATTKYGTLDGPPSSAQPAEESVAYVALAVKDLSARTTPPGSSLTLVGMQEESRPSADWIEKDTPFGANLHNYKQPPLPKTLEE